MHSGGQANAVLLGVGKVLAGLGLGFGGEGERGEGADAAVPGMWGVLVFRHLGAC